MKRRLDVSLKNNLLRNNLWLNKIRSDCINENVFFAIRDNRIDMYHNGGRVFSFDNNGFKTHLKYASVIPTNGKGYLSEQELSNYNLASDFVNNYERIKENCSNYSGIESCGVARIYNKNSYLSNSDVVVLDIEISFASLENDNKQDRIDLLLLNKNNKTIKFIEAKHFFNNDIWSRSIPKATRQIKRYQSQIQNRKNEILSEYTNYIQEINNIFSLSLPSPIDIDSNVTLLIFGFDIDQKQGRLQSQVLKNPTYSGIEIYSIGNIKQVVPKNVWKCAKIL